MQRAKLFFLSAALAALSACGGSGGDSGYTTGVTNPQPTGGTNNPPPPPTTGGSSPVVSINSDLTYSPSAISVVKGTTVTWTWQPCDGSGYGGYGYDCPTHNVTFDDGSNISSATQASGTYTRTFASTGTFKYHCTVHGAALMSGSVVVTDQ